GEPGPFRVGGPGEIPLDAEVPEQGRSGPEVQRVYPAGGVRDGGADVGADQLRGQQGAGPPLDELAFQRVVAVAGPDAVGAFQHAEIDPGAAGGTGFDLHAGMPGAQLVQEPVQLKGLYMHPRLAAG